MLNGFYTTKEAAEILNLTRNHVITLCNQGKMPGAQKMGWSWVIPEDTIKNYKPAPNGFAAVWERLKAKEAALNNEIKLAVEQAAK